MRSTLLRLGALAVLAALTSCATTSVVSSWKDPSQAEPIGKVMVIGVTDQAELRRQFEDTFVRKLGEQQIQALHSYQFAPGTEAITRANLEGPVRTSNATHVLVTRLVDTKVLRASVPAIVQTTTVGSYPPEYGTWSRYSETSYTTIVSPGYETETKVFQLETNIYRVADEKLVWSGLSETEEGAKAGSRVDDFISTIMKRLHGDGMI